MYVTKRGSKYRAWERIVVDGKVKKISVTMDRDTPQARKKAQTALDAKKNVPVNEITYSKLVDLYIDYQKSVLKPSTWTRNEASLKRLEKAFGKNKRIAEMGAGYISKALFSVTNKPGTYNEYLKRVKAMFRWAYRNDYLESSASVDKIQPLKDIPEREKVSDKFLEADELKKVLDAAPEFYSSIFGFLALSGLRIGELIALDDEDVTDTEIIVRKTYDSNNGIINTPKTAAGWRYVHIQPELAVYVSSIRRQSNLHRMISRARPSYFVVNMYGGRLSYAKANRWFKSLCESLTGKPLTLHALRHSHVALMSAAGADLDQISRRIGHGSTQITKEIYYHVTAKQREKDDKTFDSISIFA